MKKLLVFILILLPLLINAQSKRSLLKLKDGTEIKGIIKAIDKQVIIEKVVVEDPLKDFKE